MGLATIEMAATFDLVAEMAVFMIAGLAAVRTTAKSGILHQGACDPLLLRIILDR